MDRKIQEYEWSSRIMIHAHRTTADQLQLFAVTIWRTKEEEDEFMNDPLVQSIRERRAEYEQTHGILSVTRADEYDGLLVPDQHESGELVIRIDKTPLALVEDKVHGITSLEDL